MGQTNNIFQKAKKLNGEKRGATYGFGLVFCHSAHTGINEEHKDEDVTPKNSFNVSKIGRASQGKTDTQEHWGITSRPEEIKLNRQNYKYTG